VGDSCPSSDVSCESRLSRTLDMSVHRDASMLLYEVMRRPLDPGYELAAGERDMHENSMFRRGLVMFLSVLLAFVTLSAVRVLRAPEPESVRLRRSLEEQVRKRTATIRVRQETNSSLRQEISALQDIELTRGGAGDLARTLQKMSLAAGDVEVRGPGIELVLNDAQSNEENSVGGDPRKDTEVSSERVMDRDLQIVVNGMWAAGAEAVSVNDQRITALSAIRSAGQAILVDYRPLVPPYAVRAIGDPKDLQAGFAADMAGLYVQNLQDSYGITSTMNVQDSLTVSGASGAGLRWARSLDSSIEGYPLTRLERPERWVEPS
jgi:uncharacterized protein YlxW (UPF0749 family)